MKQANYQEYLQREFAFRQVRNPNYSLRAFAAQLGLPAPKVSQMLKGKGGMSPARAKLVAKNLGLDADEAERFVALVAIRHSRSKIGKEQAEQRLRVLGQGAEFDQLSLEAFKVISDWHHFAILELLGTEGFLSNTAYVAARLGISEATAKDAVTRLFDLGLIQTEKKRWVRTKKHLSTPAGIPSHAIRSYHRQILAKADASIENVPVEARELASISMPVAPSQIDYVRSELKALRRKIALELAKPGAAKERVYCLSMQFFPLDKLE